MSKAPIEAKSESGAVANATCATCRNFMPLSPGVAAICLEQWKELPWNAAIPLTKADDWCWKHEPARSGRAA